MTLKIIEIENIKGIKNEVFNLNILANKPSLLVAPNGFGKSSFTTAFSSLNTKRIKLNDDDYHLTNTTNKPRIYVQLEKADGSIVDLNACENSNTIGTELDCFTINNQVKPRAIRQNIRGNTSVSASMNIVPIVLIDKIPDQQPFNYNFTSFKSSFGKNGSILPNITPLLSNSAIITSLVDANESLEKSVGKRVSVKIKGLIEHCNSLTGNSKTIINQIQSNMINDFESIACIKAIADVIKRFDLGYSSEAICYLASLQILILYSENPVMFKKACSRKEYEYEKKTYRNIFKDFNSTWKLIQPKEKEGKFILEFPKANHISNGQRDVLCFIALLQQARRKLKKQHGLLIIDEVFDYLDDANLISVQYYITQFIEEFVSSGKRIYPLILTHLNPNYFKNFAFSKQKVYYLLKSTATVDLNLIKLLKNRDHITIKDDVSKYLLHFHPDNINKRAEFRTLDLKETWGENDTFNQFIESEVQKYLQSTTTYDPFAVCCAVRKRVEKNIYEKIASASNGQAFLETHKTRQKLDYAEGLGIQIPEIYYLLGVIYNDGMHWKDNQDNISPIASKLENLTIKNLVKRVFD